MKVVGDMGEGGGASEERQSEVQTLLFSATVPAWIKEVTTLSPKLGTLNPKYVTTLSPKIETPNPK